MAKEMELGSIAGSLKRSEHKKKRKRPDIIADLLRDRIINERLQEGDRIPSEWVAPETLNASRGTIREALKILEIQGILSTKTGPGGGLFVSSIDLEDAILYLDNLFLPNPPSISDIYAVRKSLEPLIAADVAGCLSEGAFQFLQSRIYLYQDEPASAEEEYQQRLAELDFHTALANMCSNKLLGFICSFLHSLLRDKSECRAIYSEPTPWEGREAGLDYQVRLLRAIKAGDADLAHSIMSAHMASAEAFMLERAVLLGQRKS